MGDVITIEGYFSINPHTGRSTGQLQMWVVTGTAESSGTVTMSPFMPEEARLKKPTPVGWPRP